MGIVNQIRHLKNSVEDDYNAASEEDCSAHENAELIDSLQRQKSQETEEETEEAVPPEGAEEWVRHLHLCRGSTE